MQTIPPDARIRSLERLQTQLEERMQRCRVAAQEGGRLNPPLGRELDEKSSELARVRAELAALHSR